MLLARTEYTPIVADQCVWLELTRLASYLSIEMEHPHVGRAEISSVLCRQMSASFVAVNINQSYNNQAIVHSLLSW